MARVRGWTVAIAIVSAVLVASALAARAAESGSTPVLRPSGPASDRALLGSAVQVAGSGACLPLARELVARFLDAHPEARVTVHESIGSTGGVRAVADGAIDVGLASRALTERERALGLELVPFARVPVVVIANASVTDRELSSRGLVATFAGERDRWSDEQPVIVLLRERGDSAQAAVARVLGAFGAAVDDSLRRDRFRVLYHDDDLVSAVERTPGAIGLSDAVQASRADVRILAIDGVAPSAAAVRDGTYVFHRDLALVLGPRSSETARSLAGFVRSARARAVIADLGAVALPETR